jgi:hypothetical protein
MVDEVKGSTVKMEARDMEGFRPLLPEEADGEDGGVLKG